uniref:Major facilitator superfamily (MFS) profile domain-containing protein n=1 Tax=Panagrolaimus sp. JU765 TaxID=591449 RepID=A0AC34Q808_9BILA
MVSVHPETLQPSNGSIGEKADNGGYRGTLMWSPTMVSLLMSAGFYGGLVTVWVAGYFSDRFGAKLMFGSIGEKADNGGYRGTLMWSPTMVSLLMSAGFYGGLVTVWVAGYFSDRFGAKLMLLVAILDSMMINALTPVLATTSYYGMLASRGILGLGDGLIFPAASSMSARWFPPAERSTMAAITTSGNQIAGVFAMVMSSYLCSLDVLGGWPLIFYSFALIGFLWISLWSLFASNSPDQNKHISPEERAYIHASLEGHIHSTGNSKKPYLAPVPWFKIACSLPIYANILCQFTYNFSQGLLQTYLPLYLKQILRVELNKNGILAMLPFITTLITKNFAGILSDKLKNKGHLSNTAGVKIFQALENCGGALCCLIMAYFIDCTTLPLAIVIFLGYGAFYSFGICGFFTSQLSVAPQYTGILFSILKIASVFGSVIAVDIVGIINKHGTEEEWSLIWLIAAILNAFTAIFYVCFGSAEVQKWAVPKQAQKEIETDKNSESIDDISN